MTTLALNMGLTVQAQNGLGLAVETCDTISQLRPGMGASYAGLMQNSDYRFTAVIPHGLVAWGAAVGAPFHGFIIRLNTKPAASCICFEIGHHVDLAEDLPSPLRRARGLASVKVGNRVGTQATLQGSRDGKRFENDIIELSLQRAGYRNDVSITFVTPASEIKETKPIFAQFLSNLHFY